MQCKYKNVPKYTDIYSHSPSRRAASQLSMGRVKPDLVTLRPKAAKTIPAPLPLRQKNLPFHGRIFLLHTKGA